MANIVSLDDGDVLDLDTREGAYQYVGKFLNKHAASGSVWACLANLYRGEEEQVLLTKTREEEIL